MAGLTPRTLKSGHTVYRVKWRLPGVTDREEVETFNPAKGAHRDLLHARAFKAAVEAAGHRWPPNYMPGVGFTDPQILRTFEERAREQEAAAAVRFGDYARTWLETVAPGLEDGTVGRYRRILDAHLLPAFGALDIADPDGISPLAISRWMTSLRAGVPAEDEDGEPGWAREPLSPKSIRNLHGLLSAILQAAVDAERPLRGKNPCRESQKHLPSLEDGEGAEEMAFLTPQEYDLIRGQIEDPGARDLTDWFYGTGMRFSEATALQVRDFDLMGRRPEVRVWRAWKQKESGAYYLGAPKTKAALRPIALTPVQVDAVLPYLAGKPRESLVFQGPNGGRWTHATYYGCRWRPAVYRAARCVTCRGEDWAAGIGRRGYRDLRADQVVWCGHEGMLEVIPRVHDLRHSHVAALIRLGVPLLAISRRLGHKSIQITQDRYGHLLPEVQDDLVSGLDALLARVGAGV